MKFESVEVIGSRYIASHKVELVGTPKHEDYTITDNDGREVFKFDNKKFSLSDRGLLVDIASNSTPLTLKSKSRIRSSEWLALKGDSSDEKDLLFTVKRSSIPHLTTRIDVFLAGNEKEETCDFKIEEDQSKRFCYSVYYGDSSTVIAELGRKKDTFSVTVYPNVDRAFIIVLMMALCGMESIHEEGGNDATSKIVAKVTKVLVKYGLEELGLGDGLDEEDDPDEEADPDDAAAPHHRAGPHDASGPAR